jgi:hypothetical protein
MRLCVGIIYIITKSTNQIYRYERTGCKPSAVPDGFVTEYKAGRYKSGMPCGNLWIGKHDNKRKHMMSGSAANQLSKNDNAASCMHASGVHTYGVLPEAVLFLIESLHLSSIRAYAKIWEQFIVHVYRYVATNN